MQKFAFFSLVLILGLLTACQLPTNAPVAIGEIDSLAIAADTTTQRAIENTYEEIKSVIVNADLVYDVIGHGQSASEGGITVLRRAKGSKTDTLLTAPRNGAFQSAFITRLDPKNDHELIIVNQSAGSGSYAELVAYTIDKNGKLNKVNIISPAKNDLVGYMGKDSIYTDGKLLWRQFPIFKEGDANCCPSGGLQVLKYTLQNNSLSPSSAKN
jgi:hypothetical protein